MITTNTDGTLTASNPSGPMSTPWKERQGSRAWWWAAGAVALMLALAYAPNFRELLSSWSSDPNYSHGYLVIPIAAFILWRRLDENPWVRSTGQIRGSWLGWTLLAIILAVRFVAYEEGLQWVETATLLPAITCLTWTFGGNELLLRAWPSILFMVFMLPLPSFINGLISLPLQRIAATGSCYVLQISGFWVIQSGNVLGLRTPHGPRPLDVALACNGLKMLMCLAATVTATIILLPLSNWKRITLLISAVPIALISNILRIVGTGWCYYYIEGEKAKEWSHDISGWLMMPMALVLVGLELQLLSWLDPEKTAEEEQDRKLVLPMFVERSPGKPIFTEKSPGKKPSQNVDLREL